MGVQVPKFEPDRKRLDLHKRRAEQEGRQPIGYPFEIGVADQDGPASRPWDRRD